MKLIYISCMDTSEFNDQNIIQQYIKSLHMDLYVIRTLVITLSPEDNENFIRREDKLEEDTQKFWTCELKKKRQQHEHALNREKAKLNNAFTELNKLRIELNESNRVSIYRAETLDAKRKQYEKEKSINAYNLDLLRDELNTKTHEYMQKCNTQTQHILSLEQLLDDANKTKKYHEEALKNKDKQIALLEPDTRTRYKLYKLNEYIKEERINAEQAKSYGYWTKYIFFFAGVLTVLIAQSAEITNMIYRYINNDSAIINK